MAPLVFWPAFSESTGSARRRCDAVHLRGATKWREAESQPMLHNMFILMFWLAAAFFLYGAIAAPVTYILHRRTGARTMAAEAVIAWIVSMICLVLLYMAHDYVS